MESRSMPMPLACVPGAIPAEQRSAHFALVSRLFGEAVRERVPVVGGYAFRFPADSLEAVARFAANERLCCPFLSFSIELAAGEDGPLWLRLTGPEGTREFLEAELPR